MFKCYTLSKQGLADGVKPSTFESIASERDNLPRASLHLVPALPGVTPGEKSFGLCLSFLLDADDGVEADGSVLSVDPTCWHRCSGNSPMQLLDPCGRDGHVLLLLPKASGQLLVNTEDPELVLGTDAEGVPYTYRTSRARLMLDALSRTGIPAPAPQPGPSSPTSAASRQSSSQHKARSRSRGRSRAASSPT